MINHLFAACLMLAAQTYQVPPQVLVGILHAEGGRIGQQVSNTNGTYDLGPMQINSIWIPELAKNWKVSKQTAWVWLRDDGCTNVNVAAWILRQHLSQTGSLAKAVANYHSKTPSKGGPYKRRVVEIMRKKGLLSQPGEQTAMAAPPPKPKASHVIIRDPDRAVNDPEDKG